MGKHSDDKDGHKHKQGGGSGRFEDPAKGGGKAGGKHGGGDGQGKGGGKK